MLRPERIFARRNRRTDDRRARTPVDRSGRAARRTGSTRSAPAEASAERRRAGTKVMVIVDLATRSLWQGGAFGYDPGSRRSASCNPRTAACASPPPRWALGSSWCCLRRRGSGADLRGCRRGGARGDLRAGIERLNRFAPDSLVSHINRTAASTGLSARRRHVRTLRRCARRLARLRGRFRHHRRSADGRRTAMRRSSVSVARPRGRRRDRPRRARWTVRFTAPDVGLDFGAIAKGHALDWRGAILARRRRHLCPAARRHEQRARDRTPPEGTAGWPVAVRSAASRRMIALR